MMTNEKLPPLQKFLAFLFALLFAASLVFMGWRLVHKREYVLHEKEQCRLLAVSAADCLGEWNRAVPDLWRRLGSGDVFILIDHKLMTGNWEVSAAAAQQSGGADLTVRAASSWNSRSPQEYVCKVRVSAAGPVFAQEKDAETAKQLRELQTPQIRQFVFIYPEDRVPLPVRVTAATAAYRMDGLDYLILKKP